MRDTLFLIAPPAPGLLAGFASSLLSLASHVAQSLPDLELRLVDFSDKPTDALSAAVEDLLRGVQGRTFVGVTTCTATYQAALDVARAFKSVSRDIVVVMGGHHASPQDEVVLRCHSDVVDGVIRGEGERALVELLSRYPDVEGVPNLSRRVGAMVCRAPNAPLLKTEELDRLGPIYQPAFEGLGAPPGKFGRATYISARGCPLGCHFCAVANQQIRAKSIPAVLHELAYLVEECGYANIAIEDNFFAHSPARTLELCEGLTRLRETHHFTWDCQTRVESLKRKDVVQAMAKGGCEAVYLGVEAFTAPGLTYLGKTPTPDAYLRWLAEIVVPNLLEAGIRPYINLQVGLPCDSQQTNDETREYLARIGQSVAAAGREVTIFPQLHVLYPGTRHFAAAVATDQFGPTTWRVFEDFTLWEQEQQPVLRWLGERFAHGTGGIPVGILDRTLASAGRFEVVADAVDQISSRLDALEMLEGIEVFHYGGYLTGADMGRVV